MVANAIDAGRRANLGASRGVLNSTDDSKKMQEVQVSVLNNETHDSVEHWHPYGFSTNPKAGAEALISYLGGSRAHPIVIAIGDRRYRMKVAGGEVALHDDGGQSVHLTAGGIVVTSNGTLQINAPNIAITGDTTIKGNVAVTGGSMTHNGVNVGDSHEHQDVTPGSANTGPPAS